MNNRPSENNSVTLTAVAMAFLLSSMDANADAVTDWNKNTVLATKGATALSPALTGAASLALNSNVATRIEAIEARAVFDAINSIYQFSPKSSYYYQATHSVDKSIQNRSAIAATVQAAHDVLIGALPAANLAASKAWIDAQLAADLATVGVTDTANDPGVLAGKASAAAALLARSSDFSSIRTTYTPSTNLSVSADGKSVVPNATGNPGIGLWRPNNGGPGVVDTNTGAPTGFDVTGNIVPVAAADFNWKNVTLFSLSASERQKIIASVPSALVIGSDEYNKEIDFVKTHGAEYSKPGDRTPDQLLQALYYNSDSEIFVNEVARISSLDHGLTLLQNAQLFAALDSALADARIATWQVKYNLSFWRPISAINAKPDGSISDYTWKPLAATPAHPSASASHSATGAAGAEILRSFYKSDNIKQDGSPVTLTSLPWLIGTNNGTGKLSDSAKVGSQDGTTRQVDTFSKFQLENGRSRLYLGVHYGNDDYQGQSLGLKVATTIVSSKTDPAKSALRPYVGNKNVANSLNIKNIFVSNSDFSGFFGRADNQRSANRGETKMFIMLPRRARAGRATLGCCASNVRRWAARHPESPQSHLRAR